MVLSLTVTLNKFTRRAAACETPSVLFGGWPALAPVCAFTCGAGADELLLQSAHPKRSEIIPPT